MCPLKPAKLKLYVFRASFFFLFTASMTGTSIDLAIKNLTTVERLRAKSKVYILAIRKPPSTQAPHTNPPRSYKAPYREITYPLAVNQMSWLPPAKPGLVEKATDNNFLQNGSTPEQNSDQHHV